MVALAWISMISTERGEDPMGKQACLSFLRSAFSAGCSLTRKDGERTAMEQELDVWRVPIHDCWCRRMVCTGCDLQKWRKAISLILITRLSLRQLSNRLTSSLFLFTIRSRERGDTEMGCEIFSLTWTDCGLSVRKSSIQWQMVGFRPRRKLFHQSLQHNLMKVEDKDRILA